jgi:hypothetical protein
VNTDISVDTVGLSNEGTAVADGATSDGIDGRDTGASDGSGAPDTTADVRDAPGPGN